DRPRRLSSNQSGRGYDPVIAVGNIRSRVTFSIALSPRRFGCARCRPSQGWAPPAEARLLISSPRRNGRRLDPEEAKAVVPGDVRVYVRRQPEGAERPIYRLLGRHVRIVGPDHDLSGADQVDEIAEGSPVEEQRVVVEAASVLARRARQSAGRTGPAARAGRLFVPGSAPVVVVAGEQERKGAAAVAEGNPQAGTLLRR